MDISGFFKFEDVGQRIADLETPVPVIDLNVVERNLVGWQERCNRLGLANWPHIKTHKLVGLAKAQLAAGAGGITVQKLGEAEVMADAGIKDMLLTFNIVGQSKLVRLAALARRTNIAVVADHADVVAGLAQAAKMSGRAMAVFVECDTGARRNGVQTPTAAVELAKLIAATDGLRYGGLMTYPANGQRAATNEFLTKALALASAAGLETAIVSSGGTPDMWSDEGLTGITQFRAGTYIYNDRSLVAGGVCGYADCALTVLATVVSTPTPGRALLDAGSKALTSDLFGLVGYGVVPALGGAQVFAMSEEHGFLDTSTLGEKPRIGDLVRIVPNHVCPVSNLYDRVVFVRGDKVLGAVRVEARGKVQ